MAHAPINHSDVPVRLFKSDFLEFFTHISPVTITVIWAPIAIFFLGRAIVTLNGQPAWVIPAAFLIGLVLWTFSEYTLHRFVFHFKPRNAWQERATFLFHGVHHYQPQCKTRLVMPLALSIPMAFVFYFLFQLVIVQLLALPQWIDPMFSGFMVGYLIYDLTHYATHHFPMRSGWAKFVKRYHMLHHYKTPDARYGVSSPLWDYVFKTAPAE
jgi:sterol desaturase/sphingolipid hydroxylase (fatty acid hydroxylase superfamily)